MHAFVAVFVGGGVNKRIDWLIDWTLSDNWSRSSTWLLLLDNSSYLTVNQVIRVTDLFVISVCDKMLLLMCRSVTMNDDVAQITEMHEARRICQVLFIC